MGGGNFHAKRKSVIVELVKGKESATQLQTLLQKPVKNHGPVSAEELVLQILRSFTLTLSVLSSGTQIPAVDGGGAGESKRKPAGVKDRRGCYKRRRTPDSWVIESPTVEDGCAWRKYGQKNIMNSEYPRCYFRCTLKYEGCKATKQVQRIKGNPIIYQTTYFHHHTCNGTLRERTPHLIVGADPEEPNLISFQETTIPPKQDLRPVIFSAVKQEIEETHNDRTQSHDQDDASDAKSALVNPWEDIIGLDSMGYKPEWAPLMSSYQEEVASSLQGLDMEVNQLGDIDNFQCFDDILS